MSNTSCCSGQPYRTLFCRCGVSALPAGLRSHPRVRLRDKGGALAQRDPFFSFFDHVVQSYRSLSDYTLFMHGHDTHYHRQTPSAMVVEQP